MRCIEGTFTTRWMQSLFQLRYRRSIPSINAGPTIRSPSSRSTTRALDRGLRKFRRKRCFIWARCGLSSVSCCASEFTAWKDDRGRCEFLICLTAMSAKPPRSCLRNGWKRILCRRRSLRTSFALLQGVMDVTLRRDGKLPSDLAIATFGDHELLVFCNARYWRWRSVIVMSRRRVLEVARQSRGNA